MYICLQTETSKENSSNSLYGIHDLFGSFQLTRLRVGFSALNEHRFRHNFDCLNPLCSCGTGKEDSEHFFLHCPLYKPIRDDLFVSLSAIPRLSFSLTRNPSELCQILLSGTKSLNKLENKMIIEATITFIKASNRFLWFCFSLNSFFLSLHQFFLFNFLYSIFF